MAERNRIIGKSVRDFRSVVPIGAVQDGFVIDHRDGADGDNGGKYLIPPVYPEWLGGQNFQSVHPVRFPYIVGEMARGIATADMVVAAHNAGFLGFFGSAGLPTEEIRLAVSDIKSRIDNDQGLFGANLIHTPQQPGYEDAVVDLFMELGVKRVSASAFMRLSPAIVRYSAAGLQRDNAGDVRQTHHVFAKVSRKEVALQFMAPPPVNILQNLVHNGGITQEQAELASTRPVAADITIEADSGGHTDNRAFAAVWSSVLEAKQSILQKFGFCDSDIRLGMAGGIGTPHAAHAAFQMGADYILTGSVNQSAVESGLALYAREMLADIGPADVVMAPAADMFEQGVKVQVLKRGTLFAPRAEKLYRLFRAGFSFEALSSEDKIWLEDILGETYANAWSETEAYLDKTAPKTAARGRENVNTQFALVCRRYLFQGAQWAREGVEARRSDFQIWCGPAMGAFNEWVKGSFLEPIENRDIAQIGWNILEGATYLQRISQLKIFGFPIPANLQIYRPQRLGL